MASSHFKDSRHIDQTRESLLVVFRLSKRRLDEVDLIASRMGECFDDDHRFAPS